MSLSAPPVTTPASAPAPQAAGASSLLLGSDPTNQRPLGAPGRLALRIAPSAPAAPIAS